MTRPCQDANLKAGSFPQQPTLFTNNSQPHYPFFFVERLLRCLKLMLQLAKGLVCRENP